MSRRLLRAGAVAARTLAGAVVLVGVSALGMGAVGPATARADDMPAPLPVETGYDISHPQCGRELPNAADFVVIGVNGGRVFSGNPCLAEQTKWAYDAGTTPAYYANTANPGPLESQHWPSGQRYPQACDGDYPANDSEGCSYDYGWTAAEDSYNRAYYAALETYGEGAAKPDGDWWLDVETGNTWQTLTDSSISVEQGRRNAVASLTGAVDYLTTVAKVRQVGFYSSPTQWAQITGGTGETFAAYPVWLAGSGDRAGALAGCLDSRSFTGGPVMMAQYRDGNWDGNIRCRR